MRKLTINGKNIKLDEQTAIGLTYQSYDIQNPAKALNKMSNSFTVPSTAETLATLGNPQSVHSDDKTVYNKMSCNYFDGSNQLLDDANVVVDSIGERISLYVVEKNDIWAELKAVSWGDFTFNMVNYLFDFKGVPNNDERVTGGLADLLEYFNVNESIADLVLPYAVGGYEKTNFSTYDKIFLNSDTESGGHFCVYFRTLFEYIEHEWGVNFQTKGGGFVANIWDDPVAQKLAVPVRNVRVVETATEAYYDIKLSELTYTPYEDIGDKEGKTAYDVVLAFMQHMNIIKDEILVDNVKTLALRRFDDIENYAEVVDFSGKLAAKAVFKPKITGYAQENIIKFANIYEEGDELANSKTINSLNKNAEATTDLFEIDAYVNSVIEDDGDFLADLSTEDAYKEISILYIDTATENERRVSFVSSSNYTKVTAISENLTNGNLDTFSSTVFGRLAKGSSDLVDQYAKSQQHTVNSLSEIALTWENLINTDFFSMQVYDVTNSTELYSVNLQAKELNYTMQVGTVIEFRIVQTTVSPESDIESFSLDFFSGYINSFSSNAVQDYPLYIAKLYDLGSEYNFLEKMIQYPKVYTVKMRLTIADLYNLEFFKQYYIKELGASFFINKITGFNSRSTAPTTLELIKTSEKTPITPEGLDYFVDGVWDVFTDSDGNPFF